MRCTIEGCNITCKHPTKSMCWKDFDMCKYHAFQFYPDAYDAYRPCSSRFEEILHKFEYGG